MPPPGIISGSQQAFVFPLHYVCRCVIILYRCMAFRLPVPQAVNASGIRDQRTLLLDRDGGNVLRRSFRARFLRLFEDVTGSIASALHWPFC